MKHNKQLLGLEGTLIDCDDNLPPEAALWRAVITQQLMDAGSNSKIKYMKLRKLQAITWLSGTSRDFLEVCAMANLDPGYVRARAHLALMRKCRWRKYNENSYKNNRKKKK